MSVAIDIQESSRFISLIGIPYGALATNQACIDKGLIAQSLLNSINQQIVSEIKKAFKEWLTIVCPHLPQRGCTCRKPQAGMLNQATKYFSLDKKEVVFIGDSKADKEAAKISKIDFKYVCWNSESCPGKNCGHTLLGALQLI